MGFKEAAINVFTTSRKAILCTVGVGLVSAAFYLGLRYFRRPKKVVHVGVVSQLNIYPMKSGKGISVTTAECVEMGLKQGNIKDRHWLVITEDGHQVTARQEPRLVLVSLTSRGDCLYLNAPDMRELHFPLQQPENRVANCRVWSEDIQGRDCGDDVASWMTRYLSSDQSFRLVQFEPQMQARHPATKCPLFPQKETVAYPDSAAIMLMSEGSVTDLNTRLQETVTTAWFRPSIVVAASDAYAEDSWDEIQIGNVRMRRIMACSRCIFTTVNPETGVMNRKEPLDTLKSYRMCDPSETHIYKTSPLLGQFYSVVRTGILHVGDPVYKISY